MTHRTLVGSAKPRVIDLAELERLAQAAHLWMAVEPTTVLRLLAVVRAAQTLTLAEASGWCKCDSCVAQSRLKAALEALNG